MPIRRRSELPEYRVAMGSHDIRGWPVVDRDGQRAGIVEDLIVDPLAGHVRDALVHIDGHDHRVPVGPLVLDVKGQRVHLPCRVDELAAMPLAPEFHSRERQVVRSTFFPQIANQDILGELHKEDLQQAGRPPIEGS